MIGQRVSNYEVKALIGEGGMGSVYLAEHTLIGRKAAIKVLRKDLAADEGVVTRFINEARAANAIGHPNIVDIFDLGQLPDGVPFLVMEYLHGETLAQRMARRGPLPVDIALAFAAQAAGALAAAHAKGIVHRDLKPDNLFLVPDSSSPGAERVKILDFGIAKLVSGVASGGAVNTRPGMLMGTPQYMSPEQCRAVPDQIGPTSDIYSLGLILYEMLCGSPPFHALGEGDLVVMHITMPPPPPSQRNPQVPESVERVVLRALAKKREERWPTMEVFRDALLTTKMPSTVLLPLAAVPTPAPRASDVATQLVMPRPTPTTLTAMARSLPPRHLRVLRSAWTWMGVSTVAALGLAIAVILPATPRPAAVAAQPAPSAELLPEPPKKGPPPPEDVPAIAARDPEPLPKKAPVVKKLLAVRKRAVLPPEPTPVTPPPVTPPVRPLPEKW